MLMFWVFVLAVSMLLYVLLDGFDLGIGILFGLTANEDKRQAMLSAVAPVWDGNETWLVVACVVLWGAFPLVYATLFSAFYLPLLLMLAGLILRIRVPLQGRADAPRLGCRLRRRLSCRRFHARLDGGRSGRGSFDFERALRRR